MKQDWSPDEIIEHFTLLPTEMEFLGSNDPHNQLGKAVLLKLFGQESRFPEAPSELPRAVISHIAHQLNLPEQVIDQYDWRGRRIKEHRQAIRAFYGFRRSSLTDQAELRDWLLNEILPTEERPIYLEERVYERLQKMRIEPPSQKQMKRLITTVCHRYEQNFFMQTIEKLSPEMRQRLRDLIHYTGKKKRFSWIWMR